jgi:small GTP-binding protein
MDSYKFVAVGDSSAGKTCLLSVMAGQGFPVEFIPSVFESYSENLLIDDKPLTLNYFDTVGADDYNKVRPLNYPGAHTFLLCFSVINRRTFENVKEKWLPELQHHAPWCSHHPCCDQDRSS